VQKTSKFSLAVGTAKLSFERRLCKKDFIAYGGDTKRISFGGASRQMTAPGLLCNPLLKEYLPYTGRGFIF
jgi:hypothetical protein